jgi:hypothetical protein
VRRSCSAENIELSSDGGDSDSKKCNPVCDGACGGVWRSLDSGESGGGFCVGEFGRSLASVAVKMFSYLI